MPKFDVHATVIFRANLLPIYYIPATHYWTRPPQHQMCFQSKLGSCHGCGSSMIGLEATTSDNTVTTFLKNVCHEELEFANLNKFMQQQGEIEYYHVVY